MQYVVILLVLAAVLAVAFYRAAETGKAVAKAKGEETQPGFKAFMGYAQAGRQEIQRKKADRRARELTGGSINAGLAGMVTFGISGKFLVVKRPLSTKRIPLAKVTHVDTTPLSVIIHTDHQAIKIPTTQAGDVAELINEAIPKVSVNRLVLS